MWEWLNVNYIWVLGAAIIVLLVLLFSGYRIREGVKKVTPERWHEPLDKTLRRAIRVIEGIAAIAFGFGLAALVMSKEGAASAITLATMQEWFLEHGIRIFAMLLVGVGLWLALNKFLPILISQRVCRTKGESKTGIEKRRNTLLAVFNGVGKVFIILLILLIILDELSVPIGPILAGFGIAGIAVGFGAQYLIRDLIAGVFILLENQYRVGDVARVAGTAGLVEEITLRKTVLRDLDGIVHHVPNGEIKVASNYSRHFSRANLNIAVGYGEDLDRVIEVINRVGKEMAGDEVFGPFIKSEPKVLGVDKFADSGIELKVLGDTQPLKQWEVMRELRKRIKKAFDEEGIEIPWPHVKLYFGEQKVNRDLLCKACSRANAPGGKFCSNCGASLTQTPGNENPDKE